MPPQTLEELARHDVPPLPVDFEPLFHERLNHSLVALHVLDFLVRGLPYAFLHFGRAVLGLVIYSIAGKHLHEKRRSKR